jgi:dipeptidase E
MKKHARIALAGGGGAADSRLLDELFASWIRPQGRLLYLPIALRGIRSFDSCFEWITESFAPLAITHITMWTDLTKHHGRELEEFEAIYIGGGNTFSLLAELMNSGFDHHLKAYASEGGILYGGSAGAVILGKDIRTVSHMDRNHIGLTEVKCLDLAQEYAVYPHYEPQADQFIEEFVQKHRQPVLGISERSGIVMEANKMYSVGFEPAYQFGDQGKSEIPGQSIHG